MLILLIVVLLSILVIWGVDMGLQNLASARQAQAAIETARAAEISSIGNVAVIMLAVLVTAVLLFFAGYVIYQRIKASVKTPSRQVTEYRAPGQPASTPSIDQVLQIMMVKLMRDMAGRSQEPVKREQYMELPREDDPVIWK